MWWLSSLNWGHSLCVRFWNAFTIARVSLPLLIGVDQFYQRVLVCGQRSNSDWKPAWLVIAGCTPHSVRVGKSHIYWACCAVNLSRNIERPCSLEAIGICEIHWQLTYWGTLPRGLFVTAACTKRLYRSGLPSPRLQTISTLPYGDYSRKKQHYNASQSDTISKSWSSWKVVSPKKCSTRNALGWGPRLIILHALSSAGDALW